MSASERMRRYRARQREAALPAPLMYERPDWDLFLDPATLPQKAGCQPDELGRVVLKELIDNALDAGATVELEQSLTGAWIGYVIRDDGPGIDPVASRSLVGCPSASVTGRRFDISRGSTASSGVPIGCVVAGSTNG